LNICPFRRSNRRKRPAVRLPARQTRPPVARLHALSVLVATRRQDQFAHQFSVGVDVGVRLIQINHVIVAVLIVLPDEHVEGQGDGWDREPAIKVARDASADLGITRDPSTVTGHAVSVRGDERVPSDVVQLPRIDAGQQRDRVVGLAATESDQSLRPTRVIGDGQRRRLRRHTLNIEKHEELPALRHQIRLRERGENIRDVQLCICRPLRLVARDVRRLPCDGQHLDVGVRQYRVFQLVPVFDIARRGRTFEVAPPEDRLLPQHVRGHLNQLRRDRRRTICARKTSSHFVFLLLRI